MSLTTLTLGVHWPLPWAGGILLYSVSLNATDYTDDPSNTTLSVTYVSDGLLMLEYILRFAVTVT